MAETSGTMSAVADTDGGTSAGTVGTLDRAERAVSVLLAVVFGAPLVLCGLAGATPLLVAVAVVQGAVILAWVVVTDLPGRKGAVLLASCAAAAADIAVSVWPLSRLGTLLAVLGLSVPAMFVHQLMRGAARTRIVASLAGTAALVLIVVSPAALLQLRHEFMDSLGQTPGGTVVAAVAGAAAGGLLIAELADLISPAPRFDPRIPRGLLGVVAATGLGGSVGYLALQAPKRMDFVDGRGVLVGAAVGVLVGLLGVAAAFAEASVGDLASTQEAVHWPSTAARRLRPALGILVPLCIVSPVALLLCLAVHA